MGLVLTGLGSPGNSFGPCHAHGKWQATGRLSDGGLTRFSFPRRPWGQNDSLDALRFLGSLGQKKMYASQISNHVSPFTKTSEGWGEAISKSPGRRECFCPVSSHRALGTAYPLGQNQKDGIRPEPTLLCQLSQPPEAATPLSSSLRRARGPCSREPEAPLSPSGFLTEQPPRLPRWSLTSLFSAPDSTPARVSQGLFPPIVPSLQSRPCFFPLPLPRSTLTCPELSNDPFLQPCRCVPFSTVTLSSKKATSVHKACILTLGPFV